MDRREFLGVTGSLAVSSTPNALAAIRNLAFLQAASAGAEVKTAGCKMVPVRGGQYNVWTKRLGQSRTRMLTLHGGPGLNHMYLECFEDFLPQAGIEFYYYDQLGSVFSDNPDDSSLWTIERYTDEVEDVRKALGLEDFYLYGHSWGGMLGYEYALKYGSHLRGLIISDMVASVPAYMRYADHLRRQFPPETARKMEEYESKNDFDAPEYQKIIFEQIYAKHLCRLNPWPEPIGRSLKFFNTKIYNYLQGPNEFMITGKLKNWDRTADLGKVKTRTLVMGARYDEMDPDEMRRIAGKMPNARAVISEQGSHLCMYDDQEWYFYELIRFVKEES
jgi:proline iminopeptidase